MPKKESSDALLKPKERVIATEDMPGIPMSTAGKVIFPEGLTWIRYWVRFDNGVVRGSLDRRKLGAVVFADPAALRDLEGILHPAVRARIRDKLVVSTEIELAPPGGLPRSEYKSKLVEKA